MFFFCTKFIYGKLMSCVFYVEEKTDLKKKVRKKKSTSAGD